MAPSALLSLLLSSSLLLSLTNASTFTVANLCNYTVWAAASPGGGQKINSGNTWIVDVAAGTRGRIWGRTGCSFDSNGNGKCDTGDCGKLYCTEFGSPPNTVAEFALNYNSNLDFYDIYLVDGFNIPMNFGPVNGGCNTLHCSADVNANCPRKLKTKGGCLNPCQVYKTNEYCCYSGGSCRPTNYSQYFKNLCPQAFTYPNDNAATDVCNTGFDYNVVFCP